MARSRVLVLLALTGSVAIAAASAARAGEPSRGPDDGAGSFASAVAQAPAQPASRASDPESFLPLRDALVLALSNNLDVQLARIEPALAAQDTRQARGAFDPQASLGLGLDREASAFERAGGSTTGQRSYSGGFRGVLPFGARYSSGYTQARLDAGGRSSPGDGAVRSRWRTELTLPLLRDLGLNEARVRVLRGELGEHISQDVFAARLGELVAGVEHLYWDLAATRADVNVARRSLATAQDLLERARLQEEEGVVARVAVTQARAGVAERELDAIDAENKAAAARDRLLQALLAPTPDAYRDRDLIPEVPTFSAYEVDLDRAVAAALRSRPELAEARRRLDGAQVEARFAVNQVRPRLDLVASYDLDGLSGRGSSGRLREALPGERCGSDSSDPSERVCRGVGLAGPREGRLGGIEDSDRRGFALGAQLEVPIGNRAARAAASQRSIELRRARTELRQLEQRVIVDVRGAVRALASAAQAVRAAERRRAAAAEALEAEQERLQLGDSTPFQVLQFEGELADAERQWIGALRDHRDAITRVEQMQGTLLAARGIDVEGELAR